MTDWSIIEFWDAFLLRASAWLMETVPAILLILVLSVLLLKVLRSLLQRVRAKLVTRMQEGAPADSREVEKRIGTLFGILNSIVLLAVWIVASMILLRQMGIDIAPLLAGAGIIGLAVGFGAQELVRDVISGFFMLMENQVREGDVAIANGTGGLVEKVGLRTLVLRDASGTVHVFQNGKINTLSNMTKGWSAMVFDVGVAYKENTDHVVKVMREVAESLRADPNYEAKILEPMEIFGVDAFGDNAVTIKARLKTKPIEQWSVGREYRRRLKIAFDREGIEIPFPQRTLHWPGEQKPPQLPGS